MNRRAFLQTTAALASVGLAGCMEGPDPGGERPAYWGRRVPTANRPRDDTSTPQKTSSDESTTTDSSTDDGSPDDGSADGDPQEGRTPGGRPLEDRRLELSPGEEVSGIVAGVEPGERLVFPAGTYAWSEPAVVTADGWGIRCDPDTVFEVPAGWGDGSRGIVLATVTTDRVGDDFVLENFAFDAPGRAAPHLWLGARSIGRVTGLEYRMNGPLSHQQQGNGLTAFVADPAGTLVVEDYTQYNNGDLGGYAGGNSRVGVYVGPRNEGTIRLLNPVLQGFPNNACYVSRQPGTVLVEGGLLMNNNVSAVRLAGGVTMRGTTVVIDTDRYLEGPGRIVGPAHNTRGVWADSRGAGTDGGIVSDVSFLLKSYRRSSGLVAILDNRRMTVRDCQFCLDADLEAVQAHGGAIAVVNTRFTGQSNGSTAGIGAISGSGNRIVRQIDPGTVPYASRTTAFEWCRTHPQTPRYRALRHRECIVIGRR